MRTSHGSFLSLCRRKDRRYLRIVRRQIVRASLLGQHKKVAFLQKKMGQIIAAQANGTHWHGNPTFQSAMKQAITAPF